MIIYEPKGKAREYAPYAANIYIGCDNGCKYCYAPGLLNINNEKYLQVNQRKDILKQFEKEAIKHNKKPILLTFISDPYNIKEAEYKITQQVLYIMYENYIPAIILTKKKLVLRDIEIFKQFGKSIIVGMTITFDNEKTSKYYEPNASLPEERIEVLKELKKNNIPTWASFEPVIDTKQSLAMMEKVIDYVDVFKVGKINNYNGIDKTINWEQFCNNVIKLLQGKKYYIKYDLAMAAGINYTGNYDDYLPEPFKINSLW